jgi:hypothetical protein
MSWPSLEGEAVLEEAQVHAYSLNTVVLFIYNWCHWSYSTTLIFMGKLHSRAGAQMALPYHSFASIHPPTGPPSSWCWCWCCWCCPINPLPRAKTSNGRNHIDVSKDSKNNLHRRIGSFDEPSPTPCPPRSNGRIAIILGGNLGIASGPS